MQELKSDLILTKEITLISFSAIKKQEIKDACIKVVEITLNSIITRIDTELLAMEEEQIKDAWFDGVTNWDSEKEVEDYIKETFKTK